MSVFENGNENLIGRDVEKSGYGVEFPAHEEARTLPLGDDFPIKEVLVGVTNPFSGYSVSRAGTGNFYLIEYVVLGEGKMRAGGKTVKARAGDVLFFNKSDMQIYRADEKNPFKKIWVQFSSDYLSATISAYGLKTGVYSADAGAAFFTLYNLSKTPAGGATAYAVSRALSEIIISLAETKSENLTTAAAVKKELTFSVYQKCDLIKIAEKFNLSKSALIRCFKKEYGVTPYGYLLGEKISAAKTLLKTTNLTVKEIAAQLKFTDEHYFSAYFKKSTGKTPLVYRKEVRNARPRSDY